jgi:hypothetical protein
VSAGAAGDAHAERFRTCCEQYLGIARALGEALGRASAAGGDPGQQARAFGESLAGLQQHFAGLWTAMPFGAPPAAAHGNAEAGQRIVQLAAELGKAQAQLSAQWNEIIATALRQLAERAPSLGLDGPSPESIRRLYDEWVDIAESAYSQAARTPAFAAAQAGLANAYSRLRSAQRELFELGARELDLPGRAELDSVHRELRELKRALRELEERLAPRAPGAR